MIGTDSKTLDLRGTFNILTPRGEAAAVMMIDYGRDRDSVFYGHLISDGSLVRAEARDVKVQGPMPAAVTKAFEPLLTLGVIQGGLGIDHGFDIAQLTKHQTFVNSQRGHDDPVVWMPYYKFLTSLLVELGAAMIVQLKNIRMSAADASVVTRRMDVMIARYTQRLEAVARASGVGPLTGSPKHVEDGESNLRQFREFVGKAPMPHDDAELVVHLRAFLSTLHRNLGELRVTVADRPREAISTVTDFVRFNTGKIEQVLAASKPGSHDIGVLARAG